MAHTLEHIMFRDILDLSFPFATLPFPAFFKIYNLLKISGDYAELEPPHVKPFPVDSAELPSDYHTISLFSWWPFFSNILIVPPASYAVLKNLNEPFYVSLQAESTNPAPPFCFHF